MGSVAIRRVTSSFSDYLVRGQAAFIVGAGADRALTGNKTPTWGQLVSQAINAKETEDTEGLISKWPTEIASAAKIFRGETEFQKLIAKISECNLGENYSNIICSLLAKSNIIVNFNYSDIVCRSLEKIAGREVIAVNREYLEHFSLPAPEANPTTIYVYHIHGRASVGSKPVIDAWDYATIEREDKEYGPLLEKVFRSRAVTTIGLSWADAPLRYSAAHSLRCHQSSNKPHIFVDFRAKNPPVITKSGYRTERAFVLGMRGSYGVQSLPVTKNTFNDCLIQLQKQIKRPTLSAPLHQIAEFLDQSGDFESKLQLDFFRGSPLNEQSTEIRDPDPSTLSTNIDKLYRRLVRDKSDPIACARIERHLRHHIYLYSGNNRVKMRQNLWSATFKKIDTNKIEDRLLFDLLCGTVEVRKRIPKFTTLANRLSPSMRNRLKLAHQVWGDGPSHTDLPKQLYDAGWESMAAKIILDEASKEAEVANTLVWRNDWRSIVRAAADAEKAARCCGSYRRQFKASIISAFWHNDEHYSRQRMLDLYSALREGECEPGAVFGIAAGLYLSMLKESSSDSEIMKELGGFGIRQSIVKAAQFKYWLKFAPREAREEFRKIRLNSQ